MGTRPLNKEPRYVLKLFIQLMYTIKTTILQSGLFLSIFVRYSMSSVAYTNPFPPRPKTPFTYVIYLYSDIQLSEGHVGSRGGGGGEASKNKLKNASFIFSMTNVKIISIFRTQAQKEYRKFFEMKGTYILNILELLLFENLQRIY